MTDLTEVKMNVAALKRVDPYIRDILETATHVALYTFNADNNEWEKTDIEGALFVYSRTGEPYNSILIMNRLNTNNLVEPVTQGLDLQLQEPFLLYRNAKCNIYGIWFYDKDECVRIGSMLNKLVKVSDENRKTVGNSGGKGKKGGKAATNNVDIFSMLSKAQEDFNTTKGSAKKSDGNGVGNSSMSENAGNIAPLSAPLGLDVTSQSVMDFFAKAKVNTGHFKPGDQPSPSVHAVTETKPFLARLMSYPAAHTLEHIEKQQRSITPQPLQPAVPSILPPAIVRTQKYVAQSTPASKPKKQNKMTPQQESVVSTLNSVSQELQRQTKSANDTNGSMSFHRIQSPTTPSTVLNQATRHGIFNIGGQTIDCTRNVHDDSMGTGSLPEAVSALPLSFVNLGMDCKPSDFTSPTNPHPPLGNAFLQASEETPTRHLHGVASAPALIPPVMFSAPSPSEPPNRPLEPLTRNQLLQAFNYLLKNDPDFINKLHEAYVKSFSEILS
ncbi:mRNA-decapping enzyme 1A [Diachasma alloeum]|uniref:mRNA-decapping enzyme 1A n=1 Tax=Diachasma alloeum TaxID=454923 RepID=UPI0007383064|nr:mRNA-decapping enzyme 1A [Diachasma alloeum]